MKHKENNYEPSPGKLHYFQNQQNKKQMEIRNLMNQLDEAPDSKRVSILYAIESSKEDYKDIMEKIDFNTPRKKNQQPLKKSFSRLTFKELKSLPPKKFLLDGIFGSGDIGMVYGPPGCGKTFVVIDMLISMCEGKHFAKRFSLSRPLNVAYCAGEGYGGLPERFSTAADQKNIEDLPNFSFFKSVPQLFTSDDNNPNNILQFILEWKAIEDTGEVQKLDVLVIDTLHTATEGADENSSSDTGIILKSCKLVAEQLGCTVILVHHTNKSGINERGSSAYRAGMDFMIRISSHDKEQETSATMLCEKVKDGNVWKPQGFHLEKPENADCVFVQWNDPNDMYLNLKASKTLDKTKILDEMKKNPEISFTASQLSEVIAKQTNYTTELLKELVDSATCVRELRNQESEKSNRNPWVYNLKY